MSTQSDRRSRPTAPTKTSNVARKAGANSIFYLPQQAQAGAIGMTGMSVARSRNLPAPIAPPYPGRGNGLVTPWKSSAEGARLCDQPLRGGGTIRQNVQSIRQAIDLINHGPSGWGDPLSGQRQMFAYWLSNVAPGGRWAGRLGEPAGNWNYGATGRSVGLSLETLLRGAGAAEQLEALSGRTGSARKGRGSPFGTAPFGDTPEGQRQIKAGYYAKCY